MPLIQLSMRKGRSIQEKKDITDAISEALIDSLKSPKNQFNQRIYEFDEENFRIPPECSSKYIIIEIVMLHGRTTEIKDLLFKNIYHNLTNLKVNASDILILLQETLIENLRAL